MRTSKKNGCTILKIENDTNDNSENRYIKDFFEYGKIFLTSLPERDVTFCDM